MINIFIGTLIIQMLAGFAFQFYIWIPFNQNTIIIYSSTYNMILALLITGTIAVYGYVKKYKAASLLAAQNYVIENLKYMFIVNVIGILFAHMFLLYTNQAFFTLYPKNNAAQIETLKHKIETLEKELEPRDLQIRIENFENDLKNNVDYLKRIEAENKNSL